MRAIQNYANKLDSITFQALISLVVKEDQKSLLLYSVVKEGIFGDDLFFSPNELDEISNYSGVLKELAKTSQEIINGESYINTITFISSNERRIISETYAQDVGVIRRVYRDSSIYELKSYFINK